MLIQEHVQDSLGLNESFKDLPKHEVLLFLPLQTENPCKAFDPIILQSVTAKYEKEFMEINMPPDKLNRISVVKLDVCHFVLL